MNRNHGTQEDDKYHQVLRIEKDDPRHKKGWVIEMVDEGAEEDYVKFFAWEPIFHRDRGSRV
jgi:hypothetical protein